MMRRAKQIAMAASWIALFTVTACGGEATTSPEQDLSQVTGVYDLEALTFDPQGSLPKTDIISRLAPADRPELYLGSDGTFRALTRDSDLRLPVLVEGSYTLRGGEVSLTFKREADSQRFLLPRKVDLVFDQTAMTLSYHASALVSLVRLRELVPEFSTEQLPDPVLGELVVVFTLNRK